MFFVDFLLGGDAGGVGPGFGGVAEGGTGPEGGRGGVLEDVVFFLCAGGLGRGEGVLGLPGSGRPISRGSGVAGVGGADGCGPGVPALFVLGGGGPLSTRAGSERRRKMVANRTTNIAPKTASRSTFGRWAAGLPNCAVITSR